MHHLSKSTDKASGPELLDSTPASLRYLYRITGVGKEILQRLLTSPAMGLVWMTIARHINAGSAQRFSLKSPNDPYRQLWGEICVLLLRSRRPEKTWKAIDDDLKKIEQLARDLRKEVISSDREDEGKPPELRRRRDAPPKTGQRFDHRSLEEYCPAIVKTINNQGVRLDGEVMRRGEVVQWPRLSEVLDGLLEYVQRERESERSRSPAVKRDKKSKAGESNRRARVFVTELAQYVERTFGLDRNTESIPVTAALASAVLKQKILRDFVRKALRGK